MSDFDFVGGGLGYVKRELHEKDISLLTGTENNKASDPEGNSRGFWKQKGDVV